MKRESFMKKRNPESRLLARNRHVHSLTDIVTLLCSSYRHCLPLAREGILIVYVCTQRNPDNVMRKISCDKLIINIGVGESGDRLTKAVRVLQQLSDQTPVENMGKS